MEATLQAVAPTAATIMEIRTACPGASAEFLLKQMESCATLDAATRAYIAEQQTVLAELQARAVAAEKAAAEAVANAAKITRPPGNEPIESASSTHVQAGTAMEAWDRYMQVELALGHTRQMAATRVNRAYPGLREQMNAEFAPQNKAKSA